MIDFPKRVVVISPTSSIGEVFVAALRGISCDFVGIGRTQPESEDDFILVKDFSVVELEKAVDKAASILGGLDLVVNFAGSHHENQSLIHSDLEHLQHEFQRVLHINSTIPLLITAVSSRWMVRSGGGHILHLASNASTLALYQSHAYTASKHALLGIVRSAATELAPFKIRVNCVAPGTVITKLNEKKIRAETGLTSRAKSILAHTPTKKFATLEGVVSTLLATCIPQPHLTGNIIFCDDGYNIDGHSWPDGNDRLYGG